jgi:hypothetical protein
MRLASVIWIEASRGLLIIGSGSKARVLNRTLDSITR